VPSWRALSLFVAVVVAAFGISFGVARLFRGGPDSASSRPTVVDVPRSNITTFGPPARLPALRSP
jgi:hypothetical protein